MLPAKATSSPTNKVYSIDHDLELKNNFWSYVKHCEKATKFLPTSNKTTCYEFFKKSFKCVNPTKKFRIPSWIPSFPTPEKTFVSNPPTCAEISQITKRMKSSESPCPLDQISIPTFVFNSYYHRNLEEKSHTTGLEKNHYYSYSQKW